MIVGVGGGGVERERSLTGKGRQGHLSASSPSSGVLQQTAVVATIRLA